MPKQDSAASLVRGVRHLPLFSLFFFIIWGFLLSRLFVSCFETANTTVECAGSGCNTLTRSPSADEPAVRGDDAGGNGVGTIRISDPPKNPIFMVPGIAGSGLMISATNALVPLCSTAPVTYPVPFRLWASLSLVRPPRSHQLCWMDIMQPTVDDAGETYTSKEGLNIEVRRRSDKQSAWLVYQKLANSYRK